MTMYGFKIALHDLRGWQDGGVELVEQGLPLKVQGRQLLRRCHSSISSDLLRLAGTTLDTCHDAIPLWNYPLVSLPTSHGMWTFCQVFPLLLELYQSFSLDQAPAFEPPPRPPTIHTLLYIVYRVCAGLCITDLIELALGASGHLLLFQIPTSFVLI